MLFRHEYAGDNVKFSNFMVQTIHGRMIRKASIDDIAAIRALAEVVFPATYRNILSAEQLDYMMEWMYSEESLRSQMLERGDVFLVEDGKGYASFRPDGTCLGKDGVSRLPRYHLEKLYVLPGWQKIGLGRRLFDAVAREVLASVAGDSLPADDSLPACDSLPAVRLELNVNRNNPAVGFYEHLGMWQDRSGDFPIGNGFYMNDYIMAVDL